MFECFGWAAIGNADVASQGNSDETFLQALKEQMKKAAVPGLVVVHLDEKLNGDLHTVTVAGARNHRHEPVIELFRWIAEKDPAAYGILYMYDDEDHHRGGDYQNEFRVWRLCRGSLQESEDLLLSPRIPTIEDPYAPEA